VVNRPHIVVLGAVLFSMVGFMSTHLPPLLARVSDQRISGVCDEKPKHFWAYRWRVEPFINQMVAIPDVFVAAEAEEVIDNPTAGCVDVDLVGIGIDPNNVIEPDTCFTNRLVCGVEP